jgi:antitoxin component of MazEF toxin-antitoxin module
MTKTLQKHGNSLALVIDKTMLETLHMTADTPVHITFHGSSMTVTPVTVGIPPDELDAAITRLRPHYRKMLKHLAG